ncbi:putative leucine rich repeat protein [Blattamonas nauphoetae]|uniref:Leucine rich repeat protein n=1 Tax=Blattamonas nauphoetae TaxID=2049346 RepID=A0ABQ9X2A4_9EUKA|nr:putative leucine rich repeat protein [Blattamonas nauphoetae]
MIDALVNLEDLNLAGNPIGSFSEVQKLSRLPMLTTLSLYDPHYSPCPACYLSNYQTFVCSSVPSLRMLDYVPITTEQRQIAEATFAKKKMYYNMRINSLKRNTTLLLRSAAKTNAQKARRITDAVSTLTEHMYDLQDLRACVMSKLDNTICTGLQMPEKSSDLESTSSSIGKLSHKASSTYTLKADTNIPGSETITSAMAEITKTIDKHLTPHLFLLSNAFNDFSDRISQIKSQSIRHLELELSTGGNIRFEEGKESDPWAQSCNQVCETRFDPTKTKKFGVDNFHISAITRIHNRFLRARFDTHLATLTDTTNPAHKKNIDYFFYAPIDNNTDDIEKIALEGFPDAADFGTDQKDAGIGLFSSLTHFAYDKFGMTTAVQKGSIEDQTPFYLLLCKVYCSSPKEAPTGVVGWTEANQNSCFFRPAPYSPNDRKYLVMNKKIVLPEYLIEMEFMNQESPPHPPAATLFSLISFQPPSSETEQKDLNVYVSTTAGFINKIARIMEEGKEAKENSSYPSSISRLPSSLVLICQRSLSALPSSLSLIHTFPPQPFLSSSFFSSVSTTTLTTVSLFNCSISRIQPSAFSSLPLLTSLYLPYNALTNFEVNNKMAKLRTLDLTGNQIVTIGKSWSNLSSLNVLNLAFNRISSQSDLDTLASSLPSLSAITLLGNPVYETRGLGDILQFCFPTLVELDNQPIAKAVDVKPANEPRSPQLHSTLSLSREDFQQASAQAFSIPLSLIRRCSLRNTQPPSPPRLLQESKEERKEREKKSPTEETAQDNALRLERELDRLTQVYPNDASWIVTVTELDLNGQKLSTLNGMSSLPHLHTLSISDNRLSSLAGLESCHSLLSLTAESNFISSLEPLSQLSSLLVLKLSSNRISVLTPLLNHPNLIQLQLEDNLIESLPSIWGETTQIEELYLGNNKIGNITEAANLLPLTSLVVVDLVGNEVVKGPDYRHLLLFYLKQLRVLDGVSVTPEEQGKARNTFLGRLTEDTINMAISGIEEGDEERQSSPFPSLSLSKAVDYSQHEKLNLSHRSVRNISILQQLNFSGLVELELNDNGIVDISTLGNLPSLKILNCARNSIKSIGDANKQTGLFALASTLESINLSSNQLSGSLSILRLDKFEKLRRLNLTENDLSFPKQEIVWPNTLKELALSRNKKLGNPPKNYFSGLVNLRILHYDENQMRSLQSITELPKITTLYASGNRLSDLNEIDTIASISTLHHVTFAHNAMARRGDYRLVVVRKMPYLMSLDMKEITKEEVDRAELGMNAGQININSLPTQTLQKLLTRYALLGIDPQASGINAPLPTQGQDSHSSLPPVRSKRQYSPSPYAAKMEKPSAAREPLRRRPTSPGRAAGSRYSQSPEVRNERAKPKAVAEVGSLEINSTQITPKQAAAAKRGRHPSPTMSSQDKSVGNVPRGSAKRIFVNRLTRCARVLLWGAKMEIEPDNTPPPAPKNLLITFVQSTYFPKIVMPKTKKSSPSSSGTKYKPSSQRTPPEEPKEFPVEHKGKVILLNILLYASIIANIVFSVYTTIFEPTHVAFKFEILEFVRVLAEIIAILFCIPYVWSYIILKPEQYLTEGYGCPRRIIQKGPYSELRHPIDYSRCFISIGNAIAYQSPVLLGIALITAFSAIQLALLEEKVLKRGLPRAHLAYTGKVRRFLPKNWKKYIF